MSSARSISSLPRPAFSLAQHAQVAAWSARHPCGLFARVGLGHEGAEEMIEVYHREWAEPLWFIVTAGDGPVVLGRFNDLDREMASIEVALSTVEAVEGSGAVWVR